MITIDQAKIDAPDFPRGAEWWARFLPSYIVATLHDDGTLSLDVTGEAHPSQGPRPPALVRRNQELAFLRWLHSLPQLEAAIVEDAGERCQCWGQPAALHNAHCCFTTARICHAKPEDQRATTTTDLARELAASPRYRTDTGAYFEEIAAQYGRDFAGVAWIQAALKIDQEASA